MAVAHPEVRSFTDFARLGLGNGAGFVAGWLYWYFWSSSVPIEAIAGAKILQAWVPLPIWEIGVVLMAAMTAVNLMSTRSYGEFEFWFSSIKVAAILAFILVAGAWVCGVRFGTPAPGTASGFANLTAHGFAPHGLAAMLGGMRDRVLRVDGRRDHHGGGRRIRGALARHRKADHDTHPAHHRVLRGLDLPDPVRHPLGQHSGRRIAVRAGA